ncbi:hypothetical protein SAU060112_10637 [Staphylococcus aureus]|nr:hypothetical protein SAU060112_10637 [Staphylococcus aureus]
MNKTLQKHYNYVLKNEKSIVRNGIKTIEVLAKLLSITMLLKICFQI